MDDYQLHMPVTSWHSLDKYCLPAAPTVPDGADGSAPTGPAAEPAARDSRLRSWRFYMWEKTAKTATGSSRIAFLAGARRRGGSLPSGRFGKVYRVAVVKPRL